MNQKNENFQLNENYQFFLENWEISVGVAAAVALGLLLNWYQHGTIFAERSDLDDFLYHD